MAKDDYFVVMYQLLKVLYERLKAGQQISDKEFGQLFIELNETYWHYIVLNVANEGYIKGVREIKSLSGSTIMWRDVAITPKGIEYLFSNSMMERVKNALKDGKSIIPFI